MAFTNRIRLPFKLTRPQFPEDRSIYRKANGETKILSVVVKKTYEGETDWLPEKWHQRLAIALGHDNITVEGDKYLGGIAKDGDYEIDWQKFLDYPTAKAKFSVQVTPFENTNSNCQTCEEATQLSLRDDTFPDLLEEGQTYELNVANNDAICCYPSVFSISSFDTDYIETASLDQLGNLTIIMKVSFSSATGLSLLVYRVACPNGAYDEATVLGSVTGDEPDCSAPTDISVSATTSSSAGIDFTPPAILPDHYLWKLYKIAPITLFETLVQLGDVTSPHIDLFGLEASMSYRIYVRSQCDNTDNDSPASNFIDVQFITAPVSNLCGEYLLSYNDPFAGPSAHTNGVYQDCNGVYQTIYVPNNITRAFCARQTAPGVPYYIGTGAATLSHGTDSNCNTAPSYIKIFVGRGNVSADACSSSYAVYIDPAYSDIVPGIVVYSNPGLNTPITGYALIRSLGGTIFNINPVNGLVGSSTGISC